MNQARTTYREDYSPYCWVENNLNINDAFCSPENIDDCLKYISQEFCALGYPSIYSTANSCPYAINCDIVKYLNATFEVLKNCHEHVQVREDLENRNQRLSSDLNHINKKNANLKRSLDELERKYASSLEKERELKVKNEELQQLLKSEKDEVRKLSSQVQRQKVTHQHEARKQEATLNQMKSKISQLLSPKNPKKVASISPSFALPRNSSQRAKWQTGTVAKSSLEEMYNSVISSYESRWKETVDEYYNFMEYIQSQMIEILSVLQNDGKGATSNANPINVINTQGKNVQHLKEYVKYLMSKVKDYAVQNIKNSDIKNNEELMSLKSKLCEYEKMIEKYKELEQMNICGAQCKATEKMPDAEQIHLLKEKMALEEMSACIEKKKADIEAQRLDLIRFSMQQKTSKSQWHQGLKTVPSACVITTRSGMTAVPSKNQLKLCLSAPDQFEKILEPLWKSDESKVEKINHSKSEEVFSTANISNKNEKSPFNDPASISLTNADLPSWAVSNVEEKHIEVNESQGDICDKQLIEEKTTCVTSNVSVNDLVDEPSSEELNLTRLKAAMEEIEQRRNILSPPS